MLHLERATGDGPTVHFAIFLDYCGQAICWSLITDESFPRGCMGGGQGLGRSPSVSKTRRRGIFCRDGLRFCSRSQFLPGSPNDWECLVRPGRKIGSRGAIYFLVKLAK